MGDMGETMQAVRFHGKGDLRYEQIPVPAVGKGQVKVQRPHLGIHNSQLTHAQIKPSWVGICGTGTYYPPSPSRPPIQDHATNSRHWQFSALPQPCHNPNNMPSYSPHQN